MIDYQKLYKELQPDMEAVADPLFEMSEQLLRRRGDFLPHAAVLNADGSVRLVNAATENDLTTSTEILPLLHDGLRAHANQLDVIAIGVAENVNITPVGRPSTDAIKVLFEHRRGLVVALYLPFKNQARQGFSFGEMFVIRAAGEVNAWS